MDSISTSRIQPGDGRRIHARYQAWGDIVPLPPDGLLWSGGGVSLELYLVLGDAWGQLISRYLRPNSTVLDIGCGCGRAARTLIQNPYVRSYVGFDVIRENIEWCQTFIEPASGGVCRFHHYDLYSSEYNRSGVVPASSLVFPCDDRSVAVCIGASVFTHLLEPDAVHYLEQIARVLTTDGTALLSIHNAVPSGARYVGTETRVDIATEYFVELASSAGLLQRDCLDDLGGQQVHVFGKRR